MGFQRRLARIGVDFIVEHSPAAHPLGGETAHGERRLKKRPL